MVSVLYFNGIVRVKLAVPMKLAVPVKPRYSCAT